MGNAQLLIDHLLQDIARDDLTLPSLPEIALHIREALEDPETSINDIVNIVATDPALTAKLIRVSNCALFKGIQPVTTLPQAISRLGLAVTQNIATAFVMEQMFMPTTEEVDQYFHQTWQDSVNMASYCFIIAKYFTKLSPDDALIAGLISLIGVLPLIPQIDNYPSLLDDPNIFSQVVQNCHPKIGKAILQTWEFPSQLHMLPFCVRDLSQSAELNTDAQLNIADIVILAAYCVFKDRPDHIANQVNPDTLGPFKKLQRSADDFQQHLAEYQGDIEQIQVLFHSS